MILLSVLAKQASIKRRKETLEVIVRMRCKLFHFTSNLSRIILASPTLISAKLVFSNKIFNGIFPIIVTTKTPKKYNTDEPINAQNRVPRFDLYKYAHMGDKNNGPIMTM